MKKITLDEIIDKVCNHYEINESDIKGICKKQVFVKARHLYSFIAIKTTKQNTTQIGGKINRDHSTVSHAKKKITNLMDVYPEFRKEVFMLLQFYNYEPIAIVVKEVDLLKLIKHNKMIC